MIRTLLSMKKCLEEGSKILEAFDKVRGPHHAMCPLVSQCTWLSLQWFFPCVPPKKNLIDNLLTRSPLKCGFTCERQKTFAIPANVNAS